MGAETSNASNKPARANGTLTFAATFPAVLLFGPLLVPLLTGRVFAHTDLGVFYLPMRQMYSEALAEGRLFLWSSQISNGYYIHGEGQVGAFHPWHLLLYATLPLRVAFNLELATAYVFAFAGMWLFLRRLSLSAPSRAVGATAFAFSGFFLLRLGHLNAVQVAAHIPWLLLALDLAVGGSSRERRAGTAAIAVLTGSQVLLGYPHYVWISALACLTYALLRPTAPVEWRRLWLPALGGVLGLMIGGVQLLPTADLLSHSERATAALGFQTSFSLHPFNLLQLLSPYALQSRVYAAEEELYVHEFAVYNGALCTIAVAWALLRWRMLPFRRTAVFAGVLGTVGIVLALGRYGFVYEQLAALPFLRGFRAPSRHILLLHLSLCVLAAIMYEDLLCRARQRLSGQERRWTSTPLALGFIVSAIAVVWWVFLPAGARSGSYPAHVMTGLGFLTVATILVRDAARGVSAALLAIPFLLALDLGVWGYSYAFGSPPMTIGQISALAEVPPGIDPQNLHDADGDPTINYFLFRGSRIFKAHVGLQPQRRLSPADADTLRLAGVEWVRDKDGWRRIADPMPRVRVVADARLSEDPAADLASIDIRRTALVDRPVPTPLASSEQASVTVLVDEPGRLEFAIDAEQHALLAITESFHSGWQAEVDGARLQTLRVYGDYLGVLLEPGRFRLTLTFRPQSFRYGGYVTMAGLVGAMLLLALAQRRNA